jgi:hypothetical protein
LEEDRWSKDGVSHSKMAVVVDKIRIIGGLKKKDDGGPGETAPEPAGEEYEDDFSELDGDFDLSGIEGEEIP